VKAVILDHENEIEIACAKNIALIADDNFSKERGIDRIA
jgi:hypothetical protein